MVAAHRDDGASLEKGKHPERGARFGLSRTRRRVTGIVTDSPDDWGILRRSMSRENVDKIRRGIEAFNRRDFDAALAYLRDDVTWERFLSRAEAPTPAVRGKEELRAVWESQVEAVDLRGEPEEFIPVDDDKVVVPMRMVALGSGSEVPVTASVTWLYTISEDGLCVSVQAFDTREDALKAAGL